VSRIKPLRRLHCRALPVSAGEAPAPCRALTIEATKHCHAPPDRRYGILSVKSVEDRTATPFIIRRSDGYPFLSRSSIGLNQSGTSQPTRSLSAANFEEVVYNLQMGDCLKQSRKTKRNPHSHRFLQTRKQRRELSPTSMRAVRCVLVATA
jgi:hypothetical protein